MKFCTCKPIGLAETPPGVVGGKTAGSFCTFDKWAGPDSNSTGVGPFKERNVKDPIVSASKLRRRINVLASVIEAIEPRAYLSGGGAVFGAAPVNTPASSLQAAPIYSDLVDLNGDGKADLVVASAASGSVGNSVSIALGNGDGTFQTPQTYALPFSPLTVVDGLLGTNGKPDVVVGSSNSDQIEVLMQNTNGTFTAQTFTAPLLANTQSVTIGNFGNGVEDVAVASLDNSPSTNNVAIFLNDGSGNLSLSQTLQLPHAGVASITSFAVSGGVADLAVADSVDNEVTVLTNSGVGTYAVGQTYAVGGDPVVVKSGQFDLNSNTNQDLVTANETSGSVSVLLGNGDGTFNPNAVTTSVGSTGLTKVRVANLNADSNPDLLGLLNNGSTSTGEVLLGNGDGTFHVGSTISTSAFYTSISAGDINADGLTDLLLANTSEVTVYLNTTAQDITPPTAAMAASQPAQSVGSATITFSVTYTDSQQVDASTINSNNVTVTDFNGSNRPVTLVSAGLGNGPVVTATYSIAATGGSLGLADNGTYTVTVGSSLVANANAVKEATGTIGTFTVDVNPSGPNLVAGAVNVHLKAAYVAGTRSGTVESVTILNSGNVAAKGKISIALFASPTETVAAGTQPLVTVVRAINLKANGGRTVVALPGFTWPSTLSGQEFLVAQINSTQSIAETTYADNFGISSTSTTVAAPFFDIENLWNGKIPVTFKIGRRTALIVSLRNLGNSVAKGTATVTVTAIPTGGGSATTLATLSPKLNIPTNAKGAFAATFTVPNTLSSGTYNISITVSLPGDTNAANNTVTSTATVTV